MKEPLPTAMRVARVALWYSAAFSILFILFIPWPFSHGGQEARSWLILAAYVVLSITAATLITQRRRAGWTLAIGTSLFALANAIIASVQAITGGIPEPSLSARVAGLIGAGSIYLAWLLVLGGCLRERHWMAAVR